MFKRDEDGTLFRRRVKGFRFTGGNGGRQCRGGVGVGVGVFVVCDFIRRSTLDVSRRFIVVVVVRFATPSFRLMMLVCLFPRLGVDGESRFPAREDRWASAEEGEDEVLVCENVAVLIFNTGACGRA